MIDHRSIGQHYEFVECDSCDAKTGSQTLCNICLHNRRAIGYLSERMRKLEQKIGAVKAVLDL